jgi:NAD(P)-dependent dehydrogenase (short-subunit alcohol dehydrogenase family)
MDLELRGKAAIVTGGSRGIGKAIARELAREGANVAIAARNMDALEQAAAELRSECKAIVVPVAVDTGDDAAVRSMVARVVQEFGRVDILVNCGASVGTSVAFTLEQMPQHAFTEEMNVKVLGYLRCIREVAPHMIHQGWGRIVNVSGLAARQPRSIIGSARNASVVAVSKNIAKELGPRGINVTVVHPGSTLTERYQAEVHDLAAAQGISVDEAMRKRFSPNLIGRPVDPGEIGYVVAFLVSPKSVAITGDVIPVGGGEPHVIFY